MPIGAVGQVLTQFANGVAWEDLADQAVVPPTGYSATTIQGIFNEMAERIGPRAKVEGAGAVAMTAGAVALLEGMMTSAPFATPTDTSAAAGYITINRAGYYDIRARVVFQGGIINEGAAILLYRSDNVQFEGHGGIRATAAVRWAVSALFPGVQVFSGQAFTLRALTAQAGVSAVAASLELVFVSS